MKNNRIKIIFFLCAFTILGSITNINAMKNSKEDKGILNKINDITTNQDKETQKDENYEKLSILEKKLKEVENIKEPAIVANILKEVSKQLKEFSMKFSQYSVKLTLLIKHLDTIVFNNSNDSYDLKKKYLEKTKEDYKEQKEEIEKTKNSYNAFLNVILKNNKKPHFENQINEISKIIIGIEFKIKQIDENLLSNPKFNFKESTNKKEKKIKNEEFENNEKLSTLEKQLKEFNAKFSQYSTELTPLMILANTDFFNKPNNLYAFDEKKLKSTKEDYRKQKEEIEKTKNSYNAFLNVILKNNRKPHYKDQINEISKIIGGIKFKIEQIDKNLLSNPKFNFKESTNEKK